MDYRNAKHKVVFEETIRKKDKKNYALTAAIYLLTADSQLWQSVRFYVVKNTICFEKIRLHRTNIKAYPLFCCAKDLYLGTKHITVDDLADTAIIPPKILDAISQEPIPYGDYRVVETVFPTNYRSYGQTEWNITVNDNNNGVVTINAVNEEIPGSAKIVKTSEDGKVDRINFRITGNGVDKTVQTKNGGQIQIDNLKPGVYTITEQTENKYVPQESRSVTIVSGQTSTVTFNNKLKRGDLTVTKTAEDGLEKGMKFHLYGTSLSGLTVDEYAVVGSDGKARFQGVLIGSGYTLEEVGTPDRYIVPAEQTADIEWNKVTNKSFENILKRGDLTVTKTAEDGLAEGLSFHLYGTSYSGITVDEYAVTNADGIAEFKNILIGTGYMLEEVNTPVRYVIPSSQTVNIEWNTVTQKSFDNRLKKWNLTVAKKDSETGSAQGDAFLAGAVYGIYKGEKLIDRYTTDANGRFTTKYYICGDDWSLREITPSGGYLIDTAAHHIGAEATKYTVEDNSISITVNEVIIKGKIAVIKHCDDGSTQIETPEKDAEFEIYLKQSGSYINAKESERDILVCDENGFAQSKDLPYGIYTVKQTKGWDGKEMMKPFDVFISKNGEIYRYLINNATFESLIEIVKKDIETGKVIPASGIGFKVRNVIWNTVLQWFYETIYGAVADFFTLMGNMGADIFDLDWIKATIRLFTLFGWSLFVAGVAVAVFDVAIEYQCGRANIKTTAINILKGFFACSLIGVVPVELYKFCISLQNTFSHDLSRIFAGTQSLDLAGQSTSVLQGSFAVSTQINFNLFNLLALIAFAYCVIKIFFANIKRGGILLIQMAVGSLYMFSVPRGYTDGFNQWMKQVAAICLTAFMQTTLLFLGLLTFPNNMLLGLGIMLAANEVPRIAQQFGLDSSVKVNMMSVVHATTTAVNLTRSVARATGK